jgi:hypothetical protein
VGVTEIEPPVPTNVPPQLPVYQFQDAPAPNEPPVTVNVEDPPEQTVEGDALAPVGADDAADTVTGKLEEAPDPHELVPETVIFPEEAEPEKFTVIELVPLPVAILAPEGSVHV